MIKIERFAELTASGAELGAAAAATRATQRVALWQRRRRWISS
jgi:hypothetical protein